MIEIDLKELKPGCCIVGSVGDVRICGSDGRRRQAENIRVVERGVR